MATRRLLYSMSKEKVIPAWFGKLDNKHKTPANAIFALMYVTLACSVLWKNSTWLAG